MEAIRDYLRWWGAPEAAALESALVCAEYGPQEREQAARALAAQAERLPVSPEMAQNKALLELLLGQSADIVLRELTLGANGLPALLAYVDHMVQKELVVMILESLLVRLRNEPFPTEAGALQRYLIEQGLTATEARPVSTLADLLSTILTGNCLLQVQGLFVGLQLPTQGWSHRNPEEPVGEPVVRGPKEGFVETATVNLSLLRVRLGDPLLRVEAFTIGERTATKVYLVYLASVALPSIVAEVRERLGRIQIDSVLESGYLQELMEDAPLSPFPLMRATERPDVVVGGLVEGKVALITNGSPHALLMPHTFAASMQAAEDYYERWVPTTATRMLRYLFLFIALLGPSIYVAITTYHHEMVPTSLMLGIMAAREGVPFPAVVEAFLMEIAFEAMREAGVRLPKPVGQAVSIVGGLVIGDAAVRAGLVSPILVVVVALTGIASFVIPYFSTAVAIRFLRFPMMFLAGTFGFYGLTVGIFVLFGHLASLRSFGVPYLSPVMPLTIADLGDTFVRAPWWALRRRPQFMPTPNRVRQAAGQRPQPPKR